MNATWIVTVFEVIDTTMECLDHHSHGLAKVPDSEVLTVAVVAAKYFQNHHERTLAVLKALHYLSGPLSPSRFNRRLHALAERRSSWVLRRPTPSSSCPFHARICSSWSCWQRSWCRSM